MKAHLLVPVLAIAFAVIGLTVWVDTTAWPTMPVTRQASPPATPPTGLHGSPRCAAVSTKPDAAPGSSVRTTEAELFQAIVRLRTPQGPGGSLVVEVASLPIIPFRVPEDHGFLAALPADLKARVLSGASDCFQLTADRFPPNTRLLPLTEIRGVASGRTDWPGFRARFDGAKMWFAFSRALLGKDGRDAVVFYERQCDGLCGEAEWVWFTRSAADQPWKVAKEVWSWIS